MNRAKPYPTLQRLGIGVEIGRIKNANENLVAEKAVAEVPFVT